MQQLPDLEKRDPNEESSSLKWTKYIGGKEVRVHFKIDTDK